MHCNRCWTASASDTHPSVCIEKALRSFFGNQSSDADMKPTISPKSSEFALLRICLKGNIRSTFAKCVYFNLNSGTWVGITFFLKISERVGIGYCVIL